MRFLAGYSDCPSIDFPSRFYRFFLGFAEMTRQPFENHRWGKESYMNVVIQIQAVSGHKQFDFQGFNPGDLHALRSIWFRKSFQVLRFALPGGTASGLSAFGPYVLFSRFLCTS